MIFVAVASDPVHLIVVLPIAFASVVYVMWATRDGEIYVEDALSDAGGSERKSPDPF